MGSSRDYSDRRRAKVDLAGDLAARGWTLSGFTEDRSDSMSDYYAPATWDGVATKGDLVLCVDVAKWRADDYSGNPIEERVPEVGPPCERCGGAGKDPSGWSLERARATPHEFHRDSLVRKYGQIAVHSGQVFAVCPDAVSPHYFDYAGDYKCETCHGAGTVPVAPSIKVVGYWPVFQANPPRCTWHVERDGKILDSGTGISKWRGGYSDDGKLRAAAERKRFIDRIEGLAGGTRKPDAPRETTDGEITSTGANVRLNVDRDGIEIRFPAKPAPSTLGALKAAGWRWSRAGGVWYVRDTAEARAWVLRVYGVDLARRPDAGPAMAAEPAEVFKVEGLAGFEARTIPAGAIGVTR